MAGERGTHTQPTGMVTIEFTTYEDETVGMDRSKLVHVIRQRDVDGVITVWRMVQHTYEQKVGAKGKP